MEPKWNVKRIASMSVSASCIRINGTKVECKDKSGRTVSCDLRGINGTKVECKGGGCEVHYSLNTVLMEPKWNVKGRRPLEIQSLKYRINGTKVECKVVSI